MVVAVERVILTRVRRRSECLGGMPSYDDNPDCYIAARFRKDDLPKSVTVGDNMTYGGYRNAILPYGETYNIMTGVESGNGDAVSSC